MENSRIALVLGNGFDIHHGLPTKYNDFLTIESQFLIKAKTVSINDNTYGLDGVLNSQTEDILKRSESNVWYNYFQVIKQSKQIETWIDFEIEILNALILIDTEIIKINTDKKYIQEYTNAIGNVSYFVKNNDKFLSNIFSSLELYKNQVDMQNDSYFINSKFINQQHPNVFINLAISSYIGFLFNQLNEFEQIFKNYLSHFVEFITKKYSTIDKKWNKLNNVVVANIFNFNYTNTISRYDNFINQVFIHGSIDEGNIIFGVENIPDNIHSNFKVFTKYYRRLLFKDFKNRQIVLNSSVDTIYIFGHSLDESDKNYILQFIEIVENSIIKLVILYHSDIDKATKVLNLIKYILPARLEKLISEEKLIFEEID